MFVSDAEITDDMAIFDDLGIRTGCRETRTHRKIHNMCCVCVGAEVGPFVRHCDYALHDLSAVFFMCQLAGQVCCRLQGFSSLSKICDNY